MCVSVFVFSVWDGHGVTMRTFAVGRAIIVVIMLTSDLDGTVFVDTAVTDTGKLCRRRSNVSADPMLVIYGALALREVAEHLSVWYSAAVLCGK